MKDNGPNDEIRILLIDDEPNLLDMSQELLAEVGRFEVKGVMSAPQGLNALATEKFDAVVCDYEMPGMNGINLLQTLRAGGSKVPFILFTGKGREEVVIQALNSGADFYLQKGGDVRATFTELAHKVRTAVGTRRAEEALRESEYRYKGLVERTPDMIWEIDTNGTLLYVSPQARPLLGFEPHEAIGRSLFDFIERDEVERVQGILRASILGDKSNEVMEVKARSKAGELRTIEIRSLPKTDTEGRLIGFIGLARDVTEKKRYQEMLLHSNQLMSYIIEHARSAIAVHDREMRYIYVSESYLRQYNIKDKDVIGKHHYEVFPDLPQKWRDVHQRVLAGEVMSAEDDPYVREDGTVLWTDWECRPWYDSDGKIGGLIVYTEVINERKRFDQELRANQEKLEEAMHLAKLANWEYDVVKNEMVLNDWFYRMMGTSAEEVGGYKLTPEQYVKMFVYPDDAEIVSHRFKMGSKELGPDLRGYLEHRVVRWDGEVRTVHASYHAFKDKASGRVVRVLGAIQDVEERALSNKALKEVHKHLGTLSQITEHDVQNKILVVLGNLELVRRKAKDKDLEKYLSVVEDAVKDIELQLRFMRTYIEVGQGAQGWQRLSALVPESPSSEVVIVDDLNGYEVYADHMLGKVFANLVDNSMRHGGHVRRIELRAVVEGDKLKIIYTDDGVGISDEERTTLFTPGAGHHTGFGMFLSKEILNITGLSIEERGTEGNGARFEIIAPMGKWRRVA